MGHNGQPRFEGYSQIAKASVEKFGYKCAMFVMDDPVYQKYPFYMKSEILHLAFETGLHDWVVWMDVDSIMVNPIDELFTENYDLALPTKEREARKPRQHGSFLYAGFSVWKVGEGARWILDKYLEHNVSCDQKELHGIIGKEMTLDKSVFDRVGEIVTTDHFKLKLLDQDVYFHMDAIKEMRPWEEHVKLLHFKGRYLQQKWNEYQRFIC